MMKRQTAKLFLFLPVLIFTVLSVVVFNRFSDPENPAQFTFVRESSNGVMILDATSSSPVGLYQLPVAGRVGHITIHENRLYYADIDKQSILSMELPTGVLKERYRVESRPDRFWISKRHHLIYVLSYEASFISVYSMEQGDLLSQIPVGDFRGEILFDETHDRLYLALEDQSVQVIDTSLLRSEGVVGINQTVEKLHLDTADKKLWLRQHDNQVITVVDLKTGKVIRHYGVEQ